MLPTKDKALPWPTFCLFLLLAVGLAVYYRLPDLDLRPMHLDEAILGIKFIEFWNTGWFDYDPKDYHGPALHWVSRLAGFILGWSGPASLTDADLRTVAALCGIVLVLLTLALIDVLGRHGTVVASLFCAVSPLMVFFSRYYIMEMLFAVELMALLVAFWRFQQSRHKRWLILAGMAVGMMHATKETFVINIAAMLGAWIAVITFGNSFAKRSGGLRLSFGKSRSQAQRPWLWVCLVAALTSVTLYSSGFKHWEDVMESITTYASYLKRSGGDGHAKSFSYYFMLLFWSKNYFVWTEVAILALAVAGIGRSFFGWFNKDTHKQAFLQFLSIYAILAFLCYSLIPYKTPWTILSVHHVLILLAGAGAQWIYRMAQGRLSSLAITCLIAGSAYHLCAQTMFTLNDRGSANYRAPYMYSHTSPAAMQLVQRVRDLAKTASDKLEVQVVNMDSGWPLGWYLRNMSERIGYHTTVPETIPQVPVYIVDESLRGELDTKVNGMAFEESRYFLRDGVPVYLLVEKSLWEADRARRVQEGGIP
ncbi:MAG: TIGR03663 family protein [Verrucomicrobiaceae bacterium]|nr:TIGR03663 family protein [Verrucomicrobiaceae bacterium]